VLVEAELLRLGESGKEVRREEIGMNGQKYIT
jgi:hypothetical protein